MLILMLLILLSCLAFENQGLLSTYGTALHGIQQHVFSTVAKNFPAAASYAFMHRPSSSMNDTHQGFDIWGIGSPLSAIPNLSHALPPQGAGNVTQRAVKPQALMKKTAPYTSSIIKSNATFWNERIRTIEEAPHPSCDASASASTSPVLDGPSMNLTARSTRHVFTLPPSQLMQTWGLNDLAADYEQVEKGRWHESAAEWMKKMPAQDLTQASATGGWSDRILSHLAQGNHLSAAKSLSHFHDAKQDEPWPGIMVLRNAYFAEGSQAVADCGAVWFGGCWSKKPQIAQNMASTQRSCMPNSNATTSQPRYKVVVSISNPKSRYFYHLLTETLTRLFLVADLLGDNPDIRISGLSGRKLRWVQLPVLEFMGISHKDRLVLNGCADYLLVPEAPKCSGLDTPMLNIVRAFIIHRLKAFGLATPVSPTGLLKKGEADNNIRSLSHVSDRYVVIVKRSGNREVKNHDNLAEELARNLNGTHAVRMHAGSGPLKDQFALFHRADAVVAPHGAGLSLIMGMRTGSGVVEFVTVKDANLCYLYIAFKVSRIFTLYICMHVYICMYGWCCMTYIGVIFIYLILR